MINCQLFKVRLLWEYIDKILHLKNSQVKGLSYIPATNAIHLGKDNKLHLCFQRKYHNELWNDFFRVLPELQLQNGDDTFIIPIWTKNNFSNYWKRNKVVVSLSQTTVNSITFHSPVSHTGRKSLSPPPEVTHLRKSWFPSKSSLSNAIRQVSLSIFPMA